MSDPSLPLQAAVVALLKADATVVNLVEQRVYDAPPAGALFPYVTLGDGQTLGDDRECADASEVFFQINVWSRAVGWPEAKGIAAAVRAAMKAPIAIADFTITVTEFRQAQPLRDPDGLTRRVMIEYRFLITHHV